MRTDSPFYCFDLGRECIVCASGLKLLQDDSIEAVARVAAPGTIRARFHVQGRASRWPEIIATDKYRRVHIFSKGLADKILAAGLTGIDFQPLDFAVETIKGGLKGKEDQCPEYVWGRTYGILQVEHLFYDQPAQLNSAGTEVLDNYVEIPLRKHRIKISDDQPWARDFCVLMPGAGVVHVAISAKATEFFDDLNLKEMSVWVKGDGYLF